MLEYCVEEIEKPKPKEEDEEEMEDDGIEILPEKEEPEKKVDPPFTNEYRQVAVLGIALIAISEDIGNDMALRMMNHL